MCSYIGIIAYPYNATGSSLWVTNITTIFSFAFVQWGLVIVNHNSIERFNVWSSYLSKEQLRYVCGFLYFLPFIAMIPVYYAAADKMPGARLNSSGYNAKYFKPETLALIITTEVLATISDFFLLYTVFQTKNELLRDMSNSAKMKKNIDAISADLLVSYGMTWVFLAVDIVVKILIIQGNSINLLKGIRSCLTLSFPSLRLHYAPEPTVLYNL